MFRLEIDTSNAAFEDDQTGSTNLSEVAFVLGQAADKMHEANYGVLYDSNGNSVGYYEFR